jgi:hypothetical protein
MRCPSSFEGARVEFLEYEPQEWRVERIEDEREFVPTESEVAEDPSIQGGIAYLRPVSPH